MQKHTLKISGPELDRRLEEVNNIPTKTSELENDSNFISEGVVDWADSVGGPGHIKNRTHCLDYPLGVLNKDVTSINVGSFGQIYVLFPNNRIEILKPNESIPVSYGILNLVYEEYNVYLQEVVDNGVDIVNPNIRLFGFIDKLSEVFIPDSIARKEDIGDTFKKEIYTFESDNGYSAILNLPNKDTVVNILYDNTKVNLYKNIPLSYDNESSDGNFFWKINWDGKGNLEIKEILPELLLPEHFEIYQYAEDVDEILIPSSIPRKREFKTINGQSIIGSGNIVIEGGGGAVDVPTKVSQLENDKNYITNLDIQNKADLENGKIIASQLPDYILGQLLFGGIVVSYNETEGANVNPSQNFRKKYNITSSPGVIIKTADFTTYEGVYFISTYKGKLFNIPVDAGDWLVSTGTMWSKIDNTDAVYAVAGLTGNIRATDLASALADITDANSLARKTDLPTKLSDLEADIEIGGDTEYESAIADKTLTTPNAVGGIAKGTKVSDLEGKTFAEMFDDLLFPTVNPEFTDPSASIAFKSNYSSTQEVGATGPTISNFTTGYNAGEIKLNGVKQANRGGTHNTSLSFIYVNGSVSNKTLPAKVTLGKTTFNYRAAYNQGPQPKNNKGGNYDSPLAAGTVDSSKITLNGTYPWYASTASATSTNPVVKQALVAWNNTVGSMSTGQFTVQPSGTLPQVFKLPRKLHTLQLKNALNNQMETVTDVSKDYTESTETINIGGTNVTYYVYTYSGSTRGSVTLLAKF